MEPTGTSFLTHNCDGQAASTQHDARETVVWLRGKHDASTVAALSATLAKAISLGHPDLVVDLSGVQYLGAATVSLIIPIPSAPLAAAASLAVPYNSAGTPIDLTSKITGAEIGRAHV